MVAARGAQPCSPLDAWALAQVGAAIGLWTWGERCKMCHNSSNASALSLPVSLLKQVNVRVTAIKEITIKEIKEIKGEMAR